MICMNGTTRTTGGRNEDGRAPHAAEAVSSLLRSGGLADVHKKMHPNGCRMDEFYIEHGWYRAVGVLMNKDLIEKWHARGSWDLILRSIDEGEVKLGHARWKEYPDIAEEAVVFLVERVVRKAPREVTAHDFKDNRLSGILAFFDGSAYVAISSVYAEIEPWEMTYTPHNYFSDKEHRHAALEWLLAKTGKTPEQLIDKDMEEHGLRSLLDACGRSASKLVHEFYPESPKRPQRRPSGYFDSKANRIAAISRLLEETGKPVPELSHADFLAHGLGSLINGKYKGSTILAYEEYTGENVVAWDWKRAPRNFYASVGNRVAAVAHLCETLGKRVEELTSYDVEKSDVVTVLNYYNNRVAVMKKKLGPRVERFLSKAEEQK